MHRALYWNWLKHQIRYGGAESIALLWYPNVSSVAVIRAHVLIYFIVWRWKRKKTNGGAWTNLPVRCALGRLTICKSYIHLPDKVLNPDARGNQRAHSFLSRKSTADGRGALFLFARDQFLMRAKRSFLLLLLKQQKSAEQRSGGDTLYARAVLESNVSICYADCCGNIRAR